MQEKFSPNFQMRGTLLKLCTEKGMSNNMILKIVEPMRGKTEEEKEKIASQIIKERFNTNSEQTP